MATYTVWPTAAVGSTANEVLVKEDVSDLITNLFPLDTPLQQVLSRRSMQNVFTEQPVDTFTSITRTNASLVAAANAVGVLPKPEGHVYTSGSAQYPARLKSVAEIQGIQFAVSDTDRAMAQYGIQDRFAYEALKTTQAVVNNFELSFWWALGTPPGGADFDTVGTFIARQTQGIVPWIMFSGLQATSTTPSPATHADGHGNNFGTGNQALLSGAATTAYNANGLILDQTMFKEKVMEPWWQLTGRTAGAVGFAGPRVKNVFSSFALTANGAINERTLDAAAKKVVDTVDYYDTDFGLVSINMCRYLSVPSQTTTIALDTIGNVTVPWNETIIFIHPRYWQIGVVRGVHYSPIGKGGDLEQGLIRGEQALVCTNPQGGTGATNVLP